MENYEQKYKAALGWMQGLYNGLHGKTKEEAETYFPELAESEDERIRKRIIHALHGDVLDMEETTKALIWLEKQGERKSILCKNDILHIDSLLKRLEGLCRNEFKRTIYAISEDEDWLKSLREKIYK